MKFYIKVKDKWIGFIRQSGKLELMEFPTKDMAYTFNSESDAKAVIKQVNIKNAKIVSI